jgi:thiol:disulfide interchange protein DsbD
MPIRVEWKLPEGFVIEKIQWPCPERFETADLVNYGYEGEVVLLTAFEVPPTLKPGSKVTFFAHVEWLVCKEECVPGSEDLSLELSVRDRNSKKETRWASLFDRTRENLPQFFEDWKIDAAFDKENISKSFRHHLSVSR